MGPEPRRFRCLRRHWLVALFAICLSFNIAMAVRYPLQAFRFLRRFEMIELGMDSSQVSELLPRSVRALNDGKDSFPVPLCLFDTDTYVTISYEGGVVKERSMLGNWSTGGWIWLVKETTRTIVIACVLIGLVAVGTRLFGREGRKSLLAGFVYSVTFFITFCNLSILFISLIFYLSGKVHFG